MNCLCCFVPCRTVAHVALACLAAGSSVWAHSASAAGFELPGNSATGLGRGMALTASVDDGTAVAHNPGLLSQQPGTRLTWSHQLVFSHETFTRAPSQVPQKAVVGADNATALKPSANTAPLFPLGAFLAASHQLTPNLTLAFAGYGPSAIGYKEFDVSGGQRYMLTKLEALMAYASFAVAYGKKDVGGVGVTLQWAMMPKTDMSLVIDATFVPTMSPYYASNDVVATLKLSDMTAFSAIVGGWYRVTDHLDIAASGRVMPVNFEATGQLSLSNDTPGVGNNFTPTQLSVTGSTSTLKLKIAPTASVGARWRGLSEGATETYDVEANIVWEGWSVLDDYKVENTGTINLFSDKPPVPKVITIGKRWRDTLSARLGGTYWVTPAVGVSAGGYYEQGATPLNYSHLDFPSFDRVGTGLGVRYRGESVTANLSYAHVFQERRQVSEDYGKVSQQRPLKPCPSNCEGYDNIPANAGLFETSYDMLSLSLAYKF